jgi:DNA primase
MRVDAVKARADVAALKAKLDDPATVCAALGIDDGARTQANGLLVRCPWHDDAYWSCSITKADDGTLRAHCFACCASADVLGLVARVKSLSTKTDFPKVLKAAKELVSGGEGATPSAEPTSSPRLPTETFDVIAKTLLQLAPTSASPRGSAYLSSRGLLDAARSDGWGVLPATPTALAKIITTIISTVGEDAWMASGMSNDSGGLVFPKNLLVIPWRDSSDSITTLQRRVLDPDMERHKYVFPSSRSPAFPYGIEKVASGNDDADVVYVEGATDALAYGLLCARAGKPRVVLGLPGVSNWRTPWANYANGRVAHVALDADDAGDHAIERVAEDLYQAGAVRVLRQRPHGAKDWAEILERRRS